MADDEDVVDDDDQSKIVTKFFLNNCDLQQPTQHHLRAALFCYSLWDQTYCDGEGIYGHVTPLLTGSLAEFYIQPILSCVGDIDMMLYLSHQLAIPDGYPPPTELPAEFDSRVKVDEIIDSEYPGYVYLMSAYLLTEDSNSGKYNAVRLKERRYAISEISSFEKERCEFHGPAMTYVSAEHKLFCVDHVPCLRCLSWPPQAADWPTRHRNYEWPDSETVERVVSNGCDVVYVAHPLCRQDEWMRKRQWRLSFSRAEIVLLNSWMPVQQIVYHMLRSFRKTEQLTNISDSTGTKILSNYHFKTLILWVCELKPQRWWTDDMNVVRICNELLHIFADWLRSEICPHYFVNRCNLITNTVHSEIIASQLASLTKSRLSTWFVNNYLRKCAQLCSVIHLRLFDDVSTSTKLQNAVSAVVNFRRCHALRDTDIACWFTEVRVSRVICTFPLNVRSCGYLINEVKIHSCLRDFFTAVTLLHVARRIAKRSLYDELLDVLATIVGKFVGKRRYCHQLSSELSLSQAVILMKVVANNSRSTVQQIEFKLSKAYLHRALRCKDSDSDSNYCLANVYLAVLYYTSSQYQTTLDHCTLVMRSQDHSQCSSHVVQ